MGSLNENAARGLDFVIAEAGKRGLRVLLSLENYWNVRKNTWARAGITAMVHAASKDPEGPGEDYEREDFYTDPVARRIYRDYVQELLTRNNTVTGVAYRDDPTIFAWELLNEPRCEYCPDSDIADWVNEMAAFVKSLDPNHLVTPGVEGFYSAESSPDMLYVNPSYPSGKDWSHITGQDSARLSCRRLLAAGRSDIGAQRNPLAVTVAADSSPRPAAQRGCFRDCPAASKAGRPAYFLRVFADNLSSWAGIQRILFTFVFANFHFLHFRPLRLLRNFTADICFVGVLTFSFFRSTAI